MGKVCSALAMLLLAGALVTSAAAQEAPAEPPAQLGELARLLRDPAVQAWLQQQPVETPAVTAEPAIEGDGAMMQTAVASRLDRLRRHLVELAAAVPNVGRELVAAGVQLRAELNERGTLGVILLLATFAGLGVGAEMLLKRLTPHWRRRVVGSSLVTVRERLSVVGLRLAFTLLLVVMFSLGSLGAFLVFAWPPLLRQLVLTGLVVVIAVRIAAALGRFAMAPGAPRFRVLPMEQACAEHWFVWLQVMVGWFFAGYGALGVLRGLGTSQPVRYLVAYGLGFVLLGLAMGSVWRRPMQRRHAPRARTVSTLISIWLVLLWLAWVTSSIPLFWVLLVAVALPTAIRGSRAAVNHLLRPDGDAVAGDTAPSLQAASLERGLRVVLVMGALWVLARGFGLDVQSMAGDSGMSTRLLRGAFNAVVILLVADFVWHLARTWIDNKHAEASAGLGAGSGGGEGAGPPLVDVPPEEARRRARLLTLLPILRNVGFIVLLVMAFLMALSALGIQVGPLLAGAGVVGVAVGFGAQTLVKDIISGMFYLLDDAFRVGEYIVSGSYKGTVESFSLRSIKLRHHRGALYTVPFGELGAVQNLSRDWVIDKITVGVTYDTDMAVLKRVVKQIGKEIMADPELAPNILETLKSQGVYQMGDYAIQVRMKIKTKPGEQFVVRRVIYDKLKKAFKENGISFAFPTVQVSGGDSGPAAAQTALDLAAAKPAAAKPAAA